MTGKFAFGVLAVTGALLIPGSTVGAGGFHGGGAFSIHFAGPAGILRQPHVSPRLRPPHSGSPHRIGTSPRTGAQSAPQGGDAHPAFAPHLLQQARHENPYSHIPRGHHRILFGGWTYPITTGDDWGYIGAPYGPGETAAAYTPPSIVDLSDPPAPQATPRLSSARDDIQDACRSERVTVPAAAGDREITIIRC